MIRLTQYFSNTTRRLFSTVLIIFTAIVSLNGCTATASHYQFEPAATPRYEYHYFPEVNVYYDRRRNLYHYHHADRGWLSVHSLPNYIPLVHHRYHVVQSNHYSPWKSRHAHKQHHKHQDIHRKYRNKHKVRQHSDRYRHQIAYANSPTKKHHDKKALKNKHKQKDAIKYKNSHKKVSIKKKYRNLNQKPTRRAHKYTKLENRKSKYRKVEKKKSKRNKNTVRKHQHARNEKREKKNKGKKNKHEKQG
ncbi:MAG: hypothetical protein KAJ95_06235 [Gammaproteobacteria bacterium]|nr:hypothetical protein [Gammaproteobacteria bacterium]